METTIKQPIVADDNGYYNLQLFFYVQDTDLYWAKGKTIEEAQEKIRKAKKRKPSKCFVTIFGVTTPNYPIEDAIKEVEVSYGYISWKTANTQRLGEYFIG